MTTGTLDSRNKSSVSVYFLVRLHCNLHVLTRCYFSYLNHRYHIYGRCEINHLTLLTGVNNTVISGTR